MAKGTTKMNLTCTCKWVRLGYRDGRLIMAGLVTPNSEVGLGSDHDGLAVKRREGYGRKKVVWVAVFTEACFPCLS